MPWGLLLFAIWLRPRRWSFKRKGKDRPLTHTTHAIKRTHILHTQTHRHTDTHTHTHIHIHTHTHMTLLRTTGGYFSLERPKKNPINKLMFQFQADRLFFQFFSMQYSVCVHNDHSICILRQCPQGRDWLSGQFWPPKVRTRPAEVGHTWFEKCLNRI